MNPLSILAEVAGLILVEAPGAIFKSIRCAQAQRRWLRKESLVLISEEVRTFFKGPFFWEIPDGYEVRRIEVRDASGKPRKGFLRCGDHTRGFLGHHDLDVRWDD